MYIEETHQNHNETRDFIKKGIFFSLALVAFIYHFGMWGGDAFAIIPLKAKKVMGVANSQDLQSLADICMGRKNYDCVLDAYVQDAKKNPSIENKFRLADFQRKLKRFVEAKDSYLNALAATTSMAASNHILSEIHYGLGKSFEALGSMDDSIAHYKEALKVKPETIQITVTEALVSQLKKAGKIEEAKDIIAEARKRSGQKTLFSYLDK